MHIGHITHIFKVLVNFRRDAADHFHALHDGCDIANGRRIAHFEDCESLQDFIETLTVTIQGVDREICTREQSLRFFDNVVVFTCLLYTSGSHP